MRMGFGADSTRGVGVVAVGAAVLLGAVLSATLGGCGSRYVTPGRAADFRALGITESEQAERTGDTIAADMAKRPAANFPATIAAIRVQDRGYRSYSSQGHDVGSFSIVSVHDREKQEDADRSAALPMVREVVALNRLVVGDVQTERDLREAAARVHADMLLLYTIDTKFGVETTVPALGVITLGLFPNDEARVTSTASAALIDTRSGFIYALADATADTKQLANAWTNRDAVDQSRRRAEREAYEGALEEIFAAWKRVAETYAIAGGAG